MIFFAVAILGYIGALTVRLATLSGKLKSDQWLLETLGFIAILSHGYLLHNWIDIGFGQNLSFFNMLSLVTWLVSFIVLLLALFRPLATLILFIFPLAILSIVLVWAFPSSYIINTAANPKQLIHILLAMFTFSILWIAALQAILLAVQDYKLHHKQNSILLLNLPALETMETLLFQIIWVGFILLSIVIATSFYFFQLALWPHMLQKAILVVIAWIIFAVLLIGRHFFGWRGHRAIYCTLAGVALIVVAYFGSQLILEFLL